MALSEIERAVISKRLKAYCDAKVPAHIRNELRLGYRISGHDVVLFEERPALRSPHEWQESPVAKFTFVRARNVWRLFCQHRDLRWHEYQRRPKAKEFDILLQEVDSDPTGIFFG
ncbi:MAG TPA: DUF3024 domain-containing protein [Gemmatimonadales bacterium]|nr:DUF3024 domain-containing protein [Gemmatimonadales bacterium]